MHQYHNESLGKQIASMKEKEEEYVLTIKL